MISALIISLALIGFILSLHYLDSRKQGISFQSYDFTSYLGKGALKAFIVAILMLWLMPYGAIIIIPIFVLVSLISPASRNEWKNYGKIRLKMISGLLIILLLGGFVPISQPISPDEWGQPYFIENPNAPIYPASQQYTWVFTPNDGVVLDVEIVQSIKIRTTHQFGQFGLASSSLKIGETLGFQEGRLQQAVELLNKETYFNIDPNEISLVEINDKPKHTFVVDGESHELDIRSYELRSLTLGTSASGTKVGEVFCLAKPNYGGELDLLVVVRPIGHPGLSSDRYAESLAVQWISADE